MALLLDWRFWAGLGLAALVAWGVVQTARLSGCHDSLAAAQQQVIVMGSQIRQQNAAVEGLKVASDAKLAESAKALQKAAGQAKAAAGEAARLRLAAAHPGDPVKPPAINCTPSPADRAVQTIRGGF